jgi:hypothetical protein
MADELDPVEQKFTADTAEYEQWLESAAMSAQEFADANKEASHAVDGLKDSSEEAAGVIGFTAEEWLAAAEAAAEIRDKVAEAAIEVGSLRDKSAEAAGVAVEFAGGVEIEAAAVGHLRDNALEAAVAVREMKKEEESAAAGGLLSSLIGGAGGGIPDAAGPIPLQALPAIVAAVEALLPELAGLIAGFAAAGAGAGAFALLAEPALKKVATAYTGISTAQQALATAQLNEKLAPSKAHLAAVQTALLGVKDAYAGLDPAEAGAVRGLQSLSGEWHKMSTAFEPEAFKVFDSFLTLAAKVLPDVTPFATTFADALSGLLGKAGQFAGSSGFKDWLGQFHALEGPSIKAIGTGIGNVVNAIGKLLTSQNAGSVVNEINIAFNILAGTIRVITFMIHRLAQNWEEIKGAADATGRAVRQWSHDVSADFDKVRHDVAEFGHDVASEFDKARRAVAQAGHDIAHDFDQLRHDIAAINWKAVIAWIVDPVGMAVFEIRQHTHDIAQDFDKMRHDIAAAVDAVPGDVERGFDDARRNAARENAEMRHDVASAFDGMRHDAASAADALARDVESAFDELRGEAARGAADVVGFFERLPGEALRELDALPGEMFTVGENVVDGILHGVEAAAGGLLSEAGNLAHDVEKAFTDPLSIFSPSRVMYEHGWNIVQGAIDGVRANAPQLVAEMRRLGGGVASGGLPGAYPAIGQGGGPSVHVTVPTTISGGVGAAAYQTPQFTQYLQEQVQEAVLRYGISNPGNGLSLYGRG